MVGYKKAIYHTIFSLFIILFAIELAFNQSSVSLLSWNIQKLGKSKDYTTINNIANLVKEYDLIAIQEVVSGNGGAKAVGKLVNELNRKGFKWDYAISDPTIIPKYKTERYAFIWKKSKLQNISRGHLLTELEFEIYREPFIMKFKIKNSNKVFQIINYHSRKYTDDPKYEINILCNYIISSNDLNVIIAGDFNVETSDTIFKSLLNGNYIGTNNFHKTTLKRKCKNNSYLSRSIDNVFINKFYFNLLESKVIDFVKNCDHLTEARKISDHLPILVEFEIE